MRSSAAHVNAVYQYTRQRLLCDIVTQGCSCVCHMHTVSLTEVAHKQVEMYGTCADRNLHAKKKYRVGRNAQFVVRQDVPHGKWECVPSPELQLEHEVRSRIWHW